jgi:MFS family permease
LVATTLGVALGFPTLAVYSLGLFAPELTGAFHWSRSQVMAGVMLVTGALIVASPATGYLIDRIGVRPVAIISTALLGLTFMGFALSTGSLVQYYATWLVMSFAAAGAAQVSWTRAVNQYFDAKRGLALGITLAGVGVFSLLGKPLVALLISGLGWREAYVALGLLPILVVLPAAWRGLPRAALRVGPSVDPPVSASGLSVAQALRARAFWTLAAAFLPMTLILGGQVPNLEGILASHGFPKATVVSLAPWMGVTLIVGRVVGGWLADLVWAPLLAAILMVLTAVSAFLLAQAALTFWGALMAVLLLGSAIGVEIDLTSYLTARYLGVRHYGLVYGLLYVVVALGAGVGPALYGLAFDHYGTYGQALELSVAGALLSAVLLLTLGKYPRFASGAPGRDSLRCD